MNAYRIKVKRSDSDWYIAIQGPLSRFMVTAERVTKQQGFADQWHTQWVGQVHADNLKMAMVRLLHLIPELQED